MIYTCYEMVRDCRANRPEGWAFFLSQYVPVVRRLLQRHGDPNDLDRVLLALRRPESTLFDSLDPVPERWFIAELRQEVLAELPAPDPEIAVDLEAVAAALAPFTVTEKQAVWLETMRYTAAEAGAMLRMSPATVEKIRGKASELLRGSLDSWRKSLLSDNGRALGRTASSSRQPECLPAKAFLDVLDGRTSWHGRESMEQHVSKCWHCIDHFCRMVETIELLRGIKPLDEEEAQPLRKLLGIETPKPPAWKRLIGAR